MTAASTALDENSIAVASLTSAAVFYGAATALFCHARRVTNTRDGKKLNGAPPGETGHGRAAEAAERQKQQKQQKQQQ
jgi:hypothetical protein